MAARVQAAKLLAAKLPDLTPLESLEQAADGADAA